MPRVNQRVGFLKKISKIGKYLDKLTKRERERERKNPNTKK